MTPATARSLAQRYGVQGIGFVDAPVSGGAQGARDASLAIMAGAEAEALERVYPLLQAMGKRIVHVGPPGAGQVAKACNQMIMVAATQACAEALRLANAHGLDLGALRRALMAGSAGSRVLELMGAKMAARDFSAGIEARLHHKDFAIMMDEASALGVPESDARLFGPGSPAGSWVALATAPDVAAARERAREVAGRAHMPDSIS